MISAVGEREPLTHVSHVAVGDKVWYFGSDPDVPTYKVLEVVWVHNLVGGLGIRDMDTNAVYLTYPEMCTYEPPRTLVTPLPQGLSCKVRAMIDATEMLILSQQEAIKQLKEMTECMKANQHTS